MQWQTEFKPAADRYLNDLTPKIAQRIRDRLTKAAATKNPRKGAKLLKGKYAGLWRYRVGDYRAIVKFKDAKKVISVEKVDTRGNAYR